MYDRSLHLSTMLFRAPSFGTLDRASAESLVRQRDNDGPEDPELNCGRCWMPLTDEARCGNCGAHRV